MRSTLDENHPNPDEEQEHDVHEAEQTASPGTNNLVALAVIVSYK